MRAEACTTAPRESAAVVDLADVRDDRRLRDLNLRLRAGQDRNKRALARLFQSGLVYTRSGARLGRELLLAHQHMLKAGDVLDRLDVRPGDPDVAAIERQVRGVLERTDELDARSDALFAPER